MNLEASFQVSTGIIGKQVSFQLLYGVSEYTDSEYDILMKVMSIYLLFTCHEK